MFFEVLSNLKMGQEYKPGSKINLDPKAEETQGLIQDGVIKPIEPKIDPEITSDTPVKTDESVETEVKEDLSKLKVGELRQIAVQRGMSEKKVAKMKKSKLLDALKA